MNLKDALTAAAITGIMPFPALTRKDNTSDKMKPVKSNAVNKNGK